MKTPPDQFDLLCSEGPTIAKQLAKLTIRRHPPHNRTETSKAAAERIKPKAGTMRARVYEALLDCPAGLTRAELVAITGISENSVNGRANELLTAGLVRSDGVRDRRAILVTVGCDNAG